MDVKTFKDSNERSSDCIQRKVSSNCNPSHFMQGDDLHERMMTRDSSYLRQDGGCSRQGREEPEVVAQPPRDYWTGLPCGQTGPPPGAEKERFVSQAQMLEKQPDCYGAMNCTPCKI